MANAVRAMSLEHKMGLHGSPTCVMEYDRATGWLVGEPHQGMAAMFTMMNNARLGVGVQGLAQAEAALQAALGLRARAAAGADARRASRRSSATPTCGGCSATMAATMATARAICLDCALSIDMADGDRRGRPGRRGRRS